MCESPFLSASSKIFIIASFVWKRPDSQCFSSSTLSAPSPSVSSCLKSVCSSGEISSSITQNSFGDNFPSWSRSFCLRAPRVATSNTLASVSGKMKDTVSVASKMPSPFLSAAWNFARSTSTLCSWDTLSSSGYASKSFINSSRLIFPSLSRSNSVRIEPTSFPEVTLRISSENAMISSMDTFPSLFVSIFPCRTRNCSAERKSCSASSSPCASTNAVRQTSMLMTPSGFNNPIMAPAR
mmetsp:Transcript_9665/g.27549  ORF Transcript_9665/g.27549 Transcript_9665/m.27549 type:complete len:239 (-) Transcript_9665:39-755(-)